MCCNNMWCYTDMSHCEWAVCGFEGFLVMVSLLYVGIVWFKVHTRGCRKVVKSGWHVVRPWMGLFHNWPC